MIIKKSDNSAYFNFAENCTKISKNNINLSLHLFYNILKIIRFGMDLGYLNIETLQKIYCIIPIFFLSLIGDKNSPEYKRLK